MLISIKFEVYVTTQSKSAELKAGDSSSLVKKVVLGAVKVTTVSAFLYWVRQELIKLILG